MSFHNGAAAPPGGRHAIVRELSKKVAIKFRASESQAFGHYMLRRYCPPTSNKDSVI